MKRTIRTQLLAVFIITILVTVAVCVILNQFFLKSFYDRKKQQSFITSYNRLSSQIDAGAGDEALQAILAQIRDENGISCIRTSSSWSLDDITQNCISKLQAEELRNRLMFYILVGSENSGFSIRVLERTPNYILQRYVSPSDGTEYMECFGMFGDGSFFMMSAPLSVLSDSAAISNQFFLIVFACTLIPAILFILFMTRRITKPILELAGLSDRMAGLDFSQRFSGDFGEEINLLGNSMNSMSEQLKSTIDELKKANEQLVKDIREKVEIDEMRKEFLSNVSHELKTPIALIQGYAEGLQDIPEDDRDSREYYCYVIADEAEKMNRMVKKLLTLNHLEFGQDALVTEVFDLSEMLNGLISASSLTMQKQGITVEKDYPESCMVCADEFKIEEVCTNYISNAINHAGGDNRIKISIADEGERVRVTVFNTGDLIPEESIPLLWDKFYKVDKARTREYGGSGIGLSIVKAVMEAHGEGYGVYNTDDGVAFWFCLKKAVGEFAPGKEEDIDGSDN